MHKSTLIGIFLAVLELVRHRHVRVEQNALFGEIWLVIEENCTEPLDFADADNYEYTGAKDERRQRAGNKWFTVYSLSVYSSQVVLTLSFCVLRLCLSSFAGHRL